MMRSTRLLLKLLPTYLLIAILITAVIVWMAVREIKDFNRQQTEEHLLHSTRLAREILLNQDNWERDYEKICGKIGGLSGTRLTVIDRNGVVLGDSEEHAATMEPHNDRPEFISAVQGSTGVAVRFSQTLNRDMQYLAIPVLIDGSITMVIRMAVPLQSLQEAISPMIGRLITVSVVIFILTMLVSVFVARRITRPVDLIRVGAKRISSGEFDHGIPLSGISELDSLASSMNNMASQLQERINTITQQHNEQQAILASMVEGVIAVDTKERLLRINTAAARLLECDSDRVLGHMMPEVIRHPGLQTFIRNLLKQKTHLEDDIEFTGLDHRYIRLSGAPMSGPEGSVIGVVLVLNDITRLKKLENMRQEFVGNVAHELKTPLTSIKGYAETLIDGAFEKPENAHRFLKTIKRQADRLNLILEDLLRLSKIEQQREHGQIVLKPSNLLNILAGSIRDCEEDAAGKSIKIKLDCPSEIEIQADSPLFRRAVTNLIDNAIKYSNNDTEVVITGSLSPEHVSVAIMDQGIGVDSRHLPRLFERFYRVDKGRSRKVGGTGLGLAIVKHIVLAHDGHLAVDSTPQAGSTFLITLPKINT